MTVWSGGLWVNPIRYSFPRHFVRLLRPRRTRLCLRQMMKQTIQWLPVTSYFCPFRPFTGPCAFLVTSPSCAPSSPGGGSVTVGKGEGGAGVPRDDTETGCLSAPEGMCSRLSPQLSLGRVPKQGHFPVSRRWTPRPEMPRLEMKNNPTE